MFFRVEEESRFPSLYPTLCLWNKQHIRCLQSWAALGLGCFALKGVEVSPCLSPCLPGLCQPGEHPGTAVPLFVTMSAQTLPPRDGCPLACHHVWTLPSSHGCPRVCHHACPGSATQQSTQGRLSPCLSLCPFGLCHPRRAHRDTYPRLLKRVQGSPYQQQQGPDIFHFLFSTAGAALPFHNPAPGPGKPLNETPRFVCRTQPTMPFRPPRRGGARLIL